MINMKTLVTGGAGFIGSYLVDRLIKEGHKVVVIDNLSTGKKENLNPEAKFYKINICNPKISQVFKKEKPEIVFHFAAQIDVKKSVENPAEDANVNILGTLNVLENCKRFKVKRFVFASSVGVFGEPQKLPVKENHPLNPLAPYPITKLAIEKYLNFYQNQGLDFVSLRYSNIYGPRQISTGEGGVVAIFIEKLLKNQKPTIFGDGNQTRDFLYVDDAVEAAILAINAPPGSIYNVGTNKEITINALFKLLSNILKAKIKPVFQPICQGEIIKSRIDYSKAQREFGWKPKFSLEKGLQITINWFKRNFNDTI